MDKLVGRVYKIVCKQQINNILVQQYILLNLDYNDMRKHLQVM